MAGGCRNFCSNSAVENGGRQSKAVNSTLSAIRSPAAHYPIFMTSTAMGLVEFSVQCSTS